MGKSNISLRAADLEALRAYTAARPGTSMSGNVRKALELLNAVTTLRPDLDRLVDDDGWYPRRVADPSADLDWVNTVRSHTPVTSGFVLDATAMAAWSSNVNVRWMLDQALTGDGKPVRIAVTAAELIDLVGHRQARAIGVIADLAVGRVRLLESVKVTDLVDLVDDPDTDLTPGHAAAITVAGATRWPIACADGQEIRYARAGVRAFGIPGEQ